MFETEWKRPRRRGTLAVSAVAHGGLLGALVVGPMLRVPEPPAELPTKIDWVFTDKQAPEPPPIRIARAERPPRPARADVPRAAGTTVYRPPRAVQPVGAPSDLVLTADTDDVDDPVFVGELTPGQPGGERGAPGGDGGEGPGGGERILHPGDVPELDMPEPVSTPDPIYPELARRAHVQGLVVLEAVIGSDGRVRDVHVIRTASVLLDQASMDAVRRWVYRPARIGQRPVSVYLTVTLNYRLNTI